MPHVAIMVEVVHGGLQRGLKCVWVILKQPQDDAPNQRGKEREGVLLGLRDNSFLYSQPRQGEEDPGQQVHVDLAVNVVVISKHQPPSNAGSQKGVGLQTLSLDLLLQGLQSFVREHKVRQISRVGVCGLQNGSELVP